MGDRVSQNEPAVVEYTTPKLPGIRSPPGKTISRYFHPPLPCSTFHDFVSKGKILLVKGIRGFYRLNESLKCLGLREGPCLPIDASKRFMGDILRLALTMIDPEVFPMPPWAVVQEELDLREIDHAKHLAEMHREAIESLESFQEKVAYVVGALDAQAELEAESKSGAESIGACRDGCRARVRSLH